MDLINSLMQSPSTILLVLGVIALIIVIKVVRSLIAKVTGMFFTGIALIRIYHFLSDKF
jgi:hypothetical protein